MCVAVLLAMSCGGSPAKVDSAGGSSGGAPSATSDSTAAGASASSAPSGPTSSASTAPSASSAPTPPERPFAGTAVEAQSMIQSQIDAKMKVLWQCVQDYRTKKKDLHKKVVIDVGIDQEGSLLGVTTPDPKHGDLDPTLKSCLFDALHGLPFPRSHSGVITVRQTFKDTAVYE
jgi:hypothetical protein